MTTFKKSVLIAALLAAAGTASAAVSYTPGTYTGEANGRNGPVKVEVQVDSSKILSVKVVSHHESKGLSDQPLAVIPKQIVEKQSLAVDGFSGATFSSRAVINATKAALSKASKDISPLLVAPVVAKAALPSKRSCDVVVIGSGVAGLSAGIEAKEHGADVVILEKQGLLGAGDSMNISTGVSAGGSRMIADLGIKNASAKDFENFLLKQAADKKIPINKDNVITYARRSGETIDWLMDMGVPFGRFQANKFFHITKDGSAPGPHIIKTLSNRIAQDHIDYRLNSRVTDILRQNGKITGVKVSTKDGDYTIKAKAVVIATGGFSNDPNLVKRWAPEWASRPTTGAVSLTGDGIKMAQKIGAAVVAMEQVKANYLCHPLNKTNGVSLTAITPYTVLVNHDGKRFVDESHASINFKSRAEMKQKGHEAYAVVDQTAMNNLKLMRDYASAGYFVKGNTFEELASKLDVHKKAFVDTMNRFVQSCKDGKDPEFNRKIQYPMLTPPYYASLVTPSMQSTYGGVKTDTKAQAIDVNGKVIPGLYAAGAASGHDAYSNEVGFATIIGLVYGRIAGENAAKYVK